MRIVFLCSSLEPGRDGVGDYTRLLARECVRQGHACALLALHDRHITAPIEETIPISPSPNGGVSSPHSAFGFSPIPMLRLPAAMPWPERVEKASAFRASFQPDWVSLQFVPYGFNDKGIITGLANRLQKIAGDFSRVHIMFHELWIGAAKESSLRHRFTGAIQRLFIHDMIRKLKPSVIHTHTPAYVAMLKEAGFSASLLPLFGAIPIVDGGNVQWLWAALAGVGCSINDQNRAGFWLTGFFGALHREWEPEPFFGILRRTAQTAGKQVCILAIGRTGVGETRWEQMAHEYAGDFFFLKLGEQPPEKISQCLQAMDFGIAASPWQLIGKSSTVAAMLDHGLPTIVTRDDVHFRIPVTASPSTDPLLIQCDTYLGASLAGSLKRRPALSRSSEITSRFLSQLSYKGKVFQLTANL